MKDVKIGENIVIGENRPCFIVAEISANHGGKFKNAVSLIREAKRAGANAVKFQTYTPETLTMDARNKYFRIKHPKWGSQTLYDLYKKAYTPWAWFKRLKKVADDLGIVFFSTSFDKTSVDFLEELNIPVHKIASFELVDLRLIEYIAKTKKPIILSTGMSTLSEIKEAFNAASAAGARDIMLLKCVSCYPAKPEEMNLKTIQNMERVFGCPIGLSDHTKGTAVSIAAVLLGAKIIEKHFTLSDRAKSPDSFFSIKPGELETIVENIRVAEKAIGKVAYGVTSEESKNKIFRRSLFVTEDIKKGEILTERNVKSIRPCYGLKPKHIEEILGKKARKDIKRGTPLTKSLIS